MSILVSGNCSPVDVRLMNFLQSRSSCSHQVYFSAKRVCNDLVVVVVCLVAKAALSESREDLAHDVVI